MAKITPVLWKHKKNSDGRSPIYLRISAGDTTKYKSLRVYVKETHWNGRSRRVRKSHKRYGEINALIQKKLHEAETAILDRKRNGEAVTARHLKLALSEPEAPSSGDYFSYADKVVERFRRRGQIYTYKRYKTSVKKFRQWAGEPLPFEELTPQFLRDYETHLIEGYGNKQTTVAANFSAIRSIFNKAIREGLIEQEKSPFFQFQVKAGKPERDRLTLEQVRAIEALDLEKESLIWHVRNYFLFSLYCAGVRFGDIAKMQRKNVTYVDGERRLVYRMSKTDHPMDLRLVPPAEEIASYYLSAREGSPEARLFPILDGYDTSTAQKLVQAIGNQNALVNKYLKKIARLAEIDCHLSFHVARHSFATIALHRGWGVAEISQQLGHSGGLKVTEQYLKGFAQNDLDDKMNDLFGTAGGTNDE